MEEEDEIQAQACNKFPRVGNCNINNNNNEEEEEDGTERRGNIWHNNNSRIIRVSRATGGKDRHSKVMTSKGLRDRRVRLSVSTAIQFYDLQDRLGYDQPSKAVEWLIKAASDSISELPPLSTTFPETPKQQSDHAKRHQGLLFDHHQRENNNICSSNSETSRSGSAGAGLSLSKSENRVKARERARKRTAKEKDQNEISLNNVNPNMSQTASFTELLTGGIGNNNNNSTVGAGAGVDEFNLFNKATTTRQQQHWSSTVTPMDYFSSSLPQVSVSFSSGENHSDTQMLQQFSFMHEHLVTSSTSSPVCGGEYSLSFNNRGTLQSNISSSHQYHPSLLPHHDLHQRFSSTMDGSSSNVPSFFMGGGGANPVSSSAPTLDNNNHHHQQHNNNQFSSAVFDGRLQLCYGEGSRHSDHKGKGKN